MSDYEALALKLVPPGQHPSVVTLRTRIAATLEREVQAALTRQREDTFPDLRAARDELSDRRKQLESEEREAKRKHEEQETKLAADEKTLHDDFVKKHASLDEERAAVRQRELAVRAAEEKLAQFTAVLESYMAWLDGAGDVDEGGCRFSALCEAFLSYRGQTSKGTT